MILSYRSCFRADWERKTRFHENGRLSGLERLLLSAKPTLQGARRLSFTSTFCLGRLTSCDSCCACLPSLLAAQTYDIVLQSGRVMDPESSLDAVRSIGINGNKIAAVSAGPLRGKIEVDANGLVIAPGFIDLHQHSQMPEAYGFKAMDGVTTALELEVGVSPVSEWYAAREGKSVINFGASSGHVPARMVIMHDTGGLLPRDAAMNRPATPEEQRAIEAAVQKGLDEGGLGLGMGIAYTPTATLDEIQNLFYVAAKFKRPVFVHMRAGNVIASIYQSNP